MAVHCQFCALAPYHEFDIIFQKDNKGDLAFLLLSGEIVELKPLSQFYKA